MLMNPDSKVVLRDSGVLTALIVHTLHPDTLKAEARPLHVVDLLAHVWGTPEIVPIMQAGETRSVYIFHARITAPRREADTIWPFVLGAGVLVTVDRLSSGLWNYEGQLTAIELQGSGLYKAAIYGLKAFLGPCIAANAAAERILPHAIKPDV